MMRNRTAAVLGLLALSLTASVALAGEGRYGSGADSGTPVELLELLADPDRWVDQEIRVEGTVGAVCPKAGCWMDLVADPDDPGAARMRVKVQDGQIVFPTDLTGSRVAAVGKLTFRELKGDQALAYLRHQAEERGEEFDASKAPETLRLYQIQGTGAQVKSE